MLDEARRTVVASALLSYRRALEDGEGGREPWHWMEGGRQASKKDANKFLLCSYLEVQVRGGVARRKVEGLAERELGDPPNLWAAILSIPLQAWMERFSTRPLHRFPARHRGVWQLAKRMETSFKGDARNIWMSADAANVLTSLEEDLRFGPQVARMTVGALFDEEILSGKFDVKADVHVCRVLGRACKARDSMPEEATLLARALHPENPWILDWPIWRIGNRFCRKTHPVCESCPLAGACLYCGQSREVST